TCELPPPFLNPHARRLAFAHRSIHRTLHPAHRHALGHRRDDLIEHPLRARSRLVGSQAHLAIGLVTHPRAPDRLLLSVEKSHATLRPGTVACVTFPVQAAFQKQSFGGLASAK